MTWPHLAQSQEVRHLEPGPHKCPIQRLDAHARVPAADPPLHWSGVVASPPTRESDPTFMTDPPTRVGFAGPDRFVCCSQGAADWETCEVTNLGTGVTTDVDLDPDAPPPDWLEELDDRAVWPFPGLEVAWIEEFGSEAPGSGSEVSTLSRATLRHAASGATVELDTVSAPVAGAFKLWGVRTAPDAARFALVRHLYFGENTDRYPITVFATAGPARAVYERAAERLARQAEEAERLARALRGPSPPATD